MNESNIGFSFEDLNKNEMAASQGTTASAVSIVSVTLMCPPVTVPISPITPITPGITPTTITA
jgi:hypothetical protein